MEVYVIFILFGTRSADGGVRRGSFVIYYITGSILMVDGKIMLAVSWIMLCFYSHHRWEDDTSRELDHIMMFYPHCTWDDVVAHGHAYKVDIVIS